MLGTLNPSWLSVHPQLVCPGSADYTRKDILFEAFYAPVRAGVIRVFLLRHATIKATTSSHSTHHFTQVAPEGTHQKNEIPECSKQCAALDWLCEGMRSKSLALALEFQCNFYFHCFLSAGVFFCGTGNDWGSLHSIRKSPSKVNSVLRCFPS